VKFKKKTILKKFGKISKIKKLEKVVLQNECHMIDNDDVIACVVWLYRGTNIGVPFVHSKLLPLYNVSISILIPWLH